jgi:glycosyltransferase involved in cell wall biosynthesis
MKSAALIVSLNPVDEACIQTLLGHSRSLRRLAPFIDTRSGSRAMREVDASDGLRKTLGIRSGVPIIVCAAMMREGDKLASYRLLAQALVRIKHLPWQLLILGDGRAREQVVDAMRAISERVYWAGLVSQDALSKWLVGCDLYAWPAVNEAWSMALLEAAAVGLPAVAGNEGGVASVIDDGRSGILTPARDVQAFADALALLLGDDRKRLSMGAAARVRVTAQNDLGAASCALHQLLREVVA